MLELSVAQHGWSQPLFSGKGGKKRENLLQISCHLICLERATPFSQIDLCPVLTPGPLQGLHLFIWIMVKACQATLQAPLFCLSSSSYPVAG